MAWLFVAGDTDPGNRLTAWSFTTGSHNLETQLVERTIQQAEPDLHNTSRCASSPNGLLFNAAARS